MGVIHKVAYFEVCQSKIRGRIVPASGEPSPWAYSQKQALGLVEVGIKNKLLAAEEAEYLRDEIQGSSVPQRPYLILPLQRLRWRPEALTCWDLLEAYDEFLEGEDMFADEEPPPDPSQFH